LCKTPWIGYPYVMHATQSAMSDVLQQYVYEVLRAS